MGPLSILWPDMLSHSAALAAETPFTYRYRRTFAQHVLTTGITAGMGVQQQSGDHSTINHPIG